MSPPLDPLLHKRARCPLLSRSLVCCCWFTCSSNFFLVFLHTSFSRACHANPIQNCAHSPSPHPTPTLPTPFLCFPFLLSTWHHLACNTVYLLVLFGVWLPPWNRSPTRTGSIVYYLLAVSPVSMTETDTQYTHRITESPDCTRVLLGAWGE